MGEINTFELPVHPARMPMLYAHGLERLRQLGCTCDDPPTSQGCHLVIELPTGWSFHPGPDWAERYLHNPERLQVTMIRDAHGRPRAMIIEAWREGDEYPQLHHIEVLRRFVIRQNKQEHAFILDRAAEEKRIACFMHDDGANCQSAFDWLYINYPDWRNCYAYWNE